MTHKSSISPGSLKLLVSGLIAVLGLSACTTSSVYENRYARYYDACDQRAGICYANCSDFQDPEGKRVCQSECSAKVDQCFADVARLIEADNQVRYSYSSPYYGSYGYYRPGYGYYYGPYTRSYGKGYGYGYGKGYGYDRGYGYGYDRGYGYGYGYGDKGRDNGGRGDGGRGDDGGKGNDDFNPFTDNRFKNGRVVKPGAGDSPTATPVPRPAAPAPRLQPAPSQPKPQSTAPAREPRKVLKPGMRERLEND